MIATLLLELLACVDIDRTVASPGARAVPKVKAGWQPGDEIPGWEGYDYDCPLYSGANVATVHFPTVFAGEFVAWAGYIDTPDIGSLIETTLADCTEWPCNYAGSDPGAPDIVVQNVEYPVPDVLEKTGFYTSLSGGGNLPVGWYSTDRAEPHWAYEQYCLSRMRPDEMRGIIYVTYDDGVLHHDYYRQALVQYPFDSYYPDHASWDYDYDTFYGSPQLYLGYVFVGYGGDIDYDNAWDWDAITDPDIRNAVYDRYSPYNQP